MPIEFACEECASILRVPDGTSGKRSRCPTCQHEQEIPWVVSGGQAAVASEKLSIPCPKCQHHLVCSPDLIGTRGQCKKCQHIFTISTKPVSTESAAPALVFHCPKCRQLFEGREEMRGRKGKCHVCKAVFPIELELAQPKTSSKVETTSGAKPRSTSSATSSAKSDAPPAEAKPKPKPKPEVVKTVSEEDELIILDDPEPKTRSRSADVSTSIPKPAPKPAPMPAPKPAPKPAASSGPIRFECSQCQGVMEVPGSTAGLDTECPYCQTIQTIPSASTVGQAASNASSSYAQSYGGAQSHSAPQSYAAPAAFDPLGGLDFGSANPYAAPTQTWSAPAAPSYSGGGTSSAVTVGNVMQLGFNSLFPTCFMYLLHMLIFMFVGGVMYGLLLLVIFALRGTGEVGLYVAGGGAILFLVGICLMSAWFAGSISRMALDAVRKKPFNVGDALNPAGAFNASILVVGGAILIMIVAYLPAIIHMTTGALRGLEGLFIGWMLLFIPVMILYGFSTSLALFAGADGDTSTEALQTSMRLVFKHFGTTLGVLLLSGLISGALAFVTFGISYVIPIYMSAALYHLASRQR